MKLRITSAFIALLVAFTMTPVSQVMAEQTDVTADSSDDIIVVFNEDISEDEAAEITGGEVDNFAAEAAGEDEGFIPEGEPVCVDIGGADADEYIESISQDESVEFAQPNYMYRLDADEWEETSANPYVDLEDRQWNLK